MASAAPEELLRGPDRSKAHIIRVIEGFETVMFRSKFDSWPQASDVAVSEDGRGKVAALLKRQGVNVKGLMKASPVKEPQPYIDCTGNLQVWQINCQEKFLVPSSEQSKFYSGDCHIFQYTYPGEDKEEYLIGTWFGKKSVEVAAVQNMSGSLLQPMFQKRPLSHQLNPSVQNLAILLVRDTRLMKILS